MKSNPSFLEKSDAVLKVNRISEHVIWAKINRPTARNAVNFDFIDALENLVQKIEGDEQVRLFIFSGEGDKAFISGGDLKEFHGITSEAKAIELSERMQNLFFRIETLPCWNIAFINGDAYGGGIELMLSFDFILSSPKARFGFTQGRFFLSPGWGGLTRLIEKIGRSKALELQAKFEVLSPEKALELGIVNEILDDSEQSVLEWAEKLTLNDRDFIRTLKISSLQNMESRKAAMKAEINPFAKLWVHKEHVNRVEEFIKSNKKP